MPRAAVDEMLVQHLLTERLIDLLDSAATGTAYLLERPEPRVW